MLTGFFFGINLIKGNIMKHATKPAMTTITNYIENKAKHNPCYEIDINLLKISSKEGVSIAHWLANRDFIFTNKEVLKISDNEGYSVAHIYARRKLMYKNTKLDTAMNDIEILKLSTNWGTSVAHEMATHNYIFNNVEALIIADLQGDLVADIMAELGFNFPEHLLLELYKHTSNISNYTTAHIEAKKGRVFTSKLILKLENNYGHTVAHSSALAGHIFEDEDVLSWKDEDGTTVAEAILATQYPNFTTDITVKNIPIKNTIMKFVSDTSLLEIIEDNKKIIEKEIDRDNEFNDFIKQFKIQNNKKLPFTIYEDKFKLV
jgi:hypothetical protein